MAKYRGLMVKTITYMEEAIFEAEDDFEARDIVCDMVLNDVHSFKESQIKEDWDFVDAEKISD